MDNSFRVEIYTPKELFFDADAEYLKISGLDGEYGIMKNHVPTVIALREGGAEITKDGEKLRFILGGGYLEMKDNLAKIFVADCKKNEKAE
ncbi:MAG: F0F1 ATP synthase subunit epsilon [Oscillospiraceae bacterium]|nr:F0F1 ATP synthase subunit epsilon [Oscillospiraceae bacterium]